MEKVFETEKIIVWFDKDRQLQKASWIGDNADITEKEIKEVINIEADLIAKYRPSYYIADDSKRQFIYTVDIQNWVATTLAKVCIDVGVQKFAILMPKDLIAELSTEQTAEETGKIPVEIEYFNDEVSATKWLFE